MDNFVVSARKYRPQKFEDVVGQQSIANTLKMAIKNQKLASAYLFCGPRGVGKTTCARIFAKAINCLNPREDGEACEECDSCRSFNEQRSVNIQELNAAANNSVEDIRAIIDQVRIPPQLGKYKVIILDEVHMLSASAGNALLKTLEEPPSYVIFILATTEKQKIMQTILSRCQIFDFNRMEISDIVGNLQKIAANEGVTAEDEALALIAQKADGGMRDALSIFDQVNNFAQGNITADSVQQCINALDSDYYFRMTDLLLEHNVVESMLLFNDIVNKGFNGGVFIGGLASHMRNLLMSREPATMPLLDAADNMKQRYAEQAAKCSVKFLYFAIRTCDRCSNEYRSSYNKRLSVEIALIETAQYDDDDSASAGRSPAKTLKPIFTVQPAPKERSVPKTVESQESRVESQEAESPQTTTDSTPAKERRVIKIGGNRPSLKDVLAGVNTPATPQPSAEVQNAAPVQAPAEAEPTTTDNDEASDTDDNDETNNVSLFTDMSLAKEWEKYCVRLKEKDSLMGNRMSDMLVKCVGSNVVQISLHHEMVRKKVQPFIADIEQNMQRAFDNPSIKVEINILPAELVKVITNPSELLAKMRNDNPQFANLVDELDLRFS
ncbi:MAG: DNA polymerase III subunit gamma/tau [Bacteroidaceae bacterium]|nr:DNA polymerase III subunit gamma/tau [Bacteroidaceae bacterium]